MKTSQNFLLTGAKSSQYFLLAPFFSNPRGSTTLRDFCSGAQKILRTFCSWVQKILRTFCSTLFFQFSRPQKIKSCCRCGGLSPSQTPSVFCREAIHPERQDSGAGLLGTLTHMQKETGIRWWMVMVMVIVA